jgi:hypothetical protein
MRDAVYGRVISWLAAGCLSSLGPKVLSTVFTDTIALLEESGNLPRLSRSYDMLSQA